MVAHPAAGTWTVRSESGAPITAIRQASVDLPPVVQAAVGGGGERRALGYSVQQEALHKTRFVEEGVKYEQELGTAAGQPCRGFKPIHPRRATCGEIRFTPAPGPAGKRDIYAVTAMHGEEVRKQLVATYDAPPEPEPFKVPGLAVRRVKNALRISWLPSGARIRAAMPVDYNVDVNLSDGRRLVDVVSSAKHQITIPDVAPEIGARVVVGPMREDDTMGAMRAVKLKPADSRAASVG